MKIAIHHVFFLLLLQSTLSVAQVTPPEASVTKYNDIRVINVNDGLTVRATRGDSVMVSQTEFKQGTKSQHHNHPEEEIIVLISGKMKAYSNGEEFMLNPGDVFVIPSYVPHQLEALEDSKIVEGFELGPTFLGAR